MRRVVFKTVTAVITYVFGVSGTQDNDGDRRRRHVSGSLDQSFLGRAGPVPVDVAGTRSGGVLAGVHTEFTVQVGRGMVRSHRGVHGLFPGRVRQSGKFQEKPGTSLSVLGVSRVSVIYY